MNKQERILAYKQDVAAIDVKAFNIKASIFSWLYFLYTGYSFVYFCACLLLPWLCAIFVSYIYQPLSLWVLLVGLVCAHICAGFVANRAEKHYKEQYILHETFTDDEVEPQAVENPQTTEESKLWVKADYRYYMNISPIRLAIYSFISSGLFTVYWAYYNWRVYIKKSSEDVSAFWRAFFNNLTIYELVSRMQITIKNNAKVSKLCALLFIACSMFSALFWQMINEHIRDGASAEDVSALAFASNLLDISKVFLLVPIQNSVVQVMANKVYKHTDWGLFWLAAGILLTMNNWFGHSLLQQ